MKGKKSLTEEQIAEIRGNHSESGVSMADLAKQYEISPSAVFEIINNVTYHNPKYNPPMPARQRQAIKKEIVRLAFATGKYSITDLAVVFGLSYVAIWHNIYGKKKIAEESNNA